MNDDVTEFWRNTWSAWRAGELSAVSPARKESAAGLTFERWLKASRAADNSLLNWVFSAHPPQPGEFLVVCSAPGAKAPCVMTNQRLWIFGNDGAGPCFRDVLSFADIAQLDNVRDGDCFHVAVRLRDNTERTYEKVASVPSDEAIKYAIDRCLPVAPLYDLLHDSAIIELLRDPEAMVCPSCRKVARPIKTGSAVLRAIWVLLAATAAAIIMTVVSKLFESQSGRSNTQFVAGLLVLIAVGFGIAHIRQAMKQVCPLCQKANLISRCALEELEGQKQSKLFYYSIDGGQASKGPVSIETLYSLYNSNRIPRTTLISKGNSDTWQHFPAP